MADDLTLDVDRLPTLTEVLELGRESVADVALLATVDAADAPAGADPCAVVSRSRHIDPVDEVLALLEPRIGALLEGRLREALAPALARAADGLIRAAQAELAPALRGLVEEAVAQALRQPRSIR